MSASVQGRSVTPAAITGVIRSILYYGCGKSYNPCNAARPIERGFFELLRESYQVAEPIELRPLLFARRWTSDSSFKLAVIRVKIGPPVGERPMITPSGAAKSRVEVAGSDQDRAVRLEPTSSYLIRGLPFDVLPVLLKCTFQASSIETVGSNPIFKCWTGYGASDSPSPMASIELHGLGADVPPEVRLELDWHARPHSCGPELRPILEDRRHCAAHRRPWPPGRK
jgi:hypothetical protein